MKKLIFIFLFYFLLIYNSSLSSNDNLNNLKIGLLAPFSGDYENLGNSLLLSTQLALSEIGDNRIVIIPKDTGSDNKEKFENALKEIIDRGAKIIIGPPDSKYFNILEKYNDLIFISLSNKQPKIKNNIISIGISLESQLDAIENFILNQNKKKTVIMYPQNEYASFVENKIKNLKLKNYKLFKYNSDPKVLTGEIEKLTNYSQRKKNLEYRKKILEDKDDEDSERELKKLDQMYTLGKVNFDSIIIIDFGNSLKSVLASLAFTDVDDKEILFTTVNQWFDESIFYENSVKNLYYPSIDLKNFKQYNKSYFETFKLKPNEITILAYDAIGLIYYVWKKNNGIKSINDFLIKDKIKGKIGNFSINNGVVFQKLEIYKTNKNKFTKF
tara:strand:- start:1685 stop:2839 length:1155 start_codon:yes stop_codon:yes gene_type:complete